jgi:heterodisulfide reductase subunit A-like polyferredoxin
MSQSQAASGACVFPANQAIVVGGGLAGFSAAHTIVEHGGKYLLLDKSPFCGGNSTKATSGINGSETQTQKAQGIKDTNEIFVADTLKGGAKKPEVAKAATMGDLKAVQEYLEVKKQPLDVEDQKGIHRVPTVRVFLCMLGL